MDSSTETINQRDLLDLLDFDDLHTDVLDTEKIKEVEEELSSVNRAQTMKIVEAQRFRDWFSSPRAAKLLIHGNFHGIMQEASALSLFCTTLTKAFRQQNPRVVCLVWFCGFHLGNEAEPLSGESDFLAYPYQGRPYDPSLGEDEDEYVPPYARQGVIGEMIRSFIAQLDEQCDFGSANLCPPGVDPHAIQQNTDLTQLMMLFRSMVRKLPLNITVFIIIDGIAHYEGPNYEDSMRDALDCIIGPVAYNVAAGLRVKLLVTSPRRQSMYARYFELGNTLFMDYLPRSFERYSEGKVIRSLARMGNRNFMPSTAQSWN
ncbi:hypothetical protein F4821DRAFT_279217 [Hypoxylon rubiginosum]|uniref:Uncharacterized protein n=1 Tax=Hypoxylon rubiginosum TaxID=110542 RepID=A0ACC0CYL0_9PEZI|nr:hypothetical protein F4821DRAFT_279217 [Hypoxylon rubiginosum]